MSHKLVDHIVSTFAIGIVPRELYLQFKDDVYSLIWVTWFFDWHTAGIMYASLNPPWGSGKFERKSTQDHYIANHKVRED